MEGMLFFQVRGDEQIFIQWLGLSLYPLCSRNPQNLKIYSGETKRLKLKVRNF